MFRSGRRQVFVSLVVLGALDPYPDGRDPYAGGWFKALARELADHASPPLP